MVNSVIELAGTLSTHLNHVAFAYLPITLLMPIMHAGHPLENISSSLYLSVVISFVKNQYNLWPCSSDAITTISNFTTIYV